MNENTSAACSFLTGLTTPSALAISVAIIAVALAGLVLSFLVTPEFMSIHGNSVFAEDSTDYYLFSTTAAIDLKSSGASKPKFIILGGSTPRAAFLEKDLTDKLDELRNGDMELIKLCTARQMIWDMVALIDFIPENSRGFIVIGIGPGQFNFSNEEKLERFHSPLFGYRSNLQHSLAKSYNLPSSPFLTGIYALDNSGFLLGRWKFALSNLLMRSSPKYLDSKYVDKPALSRDSFLKHSQMVQSRFSKYQENSPQNFADLKFIIQQLHERTNMSILLVENAVNPLFLDEFSLKSLYLEHQKTMNQFALDNGARYINLNGLVAFKADHFYDWTHLNDPGAIDASSKVLTKALRDINVR